MNVSQKLGLQSNSKKFIQEKISEPLMELSLRFDGFNEDIMDVYYWHLNFAYYRGKGYTPFKLEDYHYFSENSQLGTNMRQIKGGTIKAFQENLAQLVQLIKIHLMPLLKEIKQADFYKKWIDNIVDNDKIVQDLKSKGVSDDDTRLKKARSERNEAINHIKDKWVNEIDGGRMWQMNRSQSEQGLDFALLPQLFFGINLDDPFEVKKTIKEQLDSDVYPVDISLQAKEQVARFMYRFYNWLPTAVKDTDVSFRVKVSALKQFYQQIQMYVNFMKPLLVEITRKSESFESSNFYKNFDTENPEFVNLFDFSYSFIKVVGVRNFANTSEARGNHSIEDLEFTPFGLFVDSRDLQFGPFAKGGSLGGKSGFIKGVVYDSDKVTSYYRFYPSNKKEINREDFNKIEEVLVDVDDLAKYPVIIEDFYQKRRMQIIKTPQGAQQVPYMRNHVDYKASAWNIYEFASYREKLKEENLALLESFIEEVSVVKEDLINYVNYFEGDKEESQSKEKKEDENKKSEKDFTLLTGPFKGIGAIFSPLIPKFSVSKKENKKYEDKGRDIKHTTIKLRCVEDTWKVYTINKKVHGFIQY